MCALLHDDYSHRDRLEEHHVIYGNGRRQQAEKFGLKLYLCWNHHQYVGGTEAVHRNKEISDRLKVIAQQRFEETFPELSFVEIFGRNYLDGNLKEKTEEQKNVGFWFLEE